MSKKETLLECDRCHKQVEEVRTFICQHKFCGSCLTDNVYSSPICFLKCHENNKKKSSASNVCSVCEKEEDSWWFCQDCDQALCSICLNTHNKLKITRNHKIVSVNKQEFALKSVIRFYCVDCKKLYEGEFIVSHQKHETITEIEFIKKIVTEWKNDILKIKAYDVLEKSQLRDFEKKYKKKKKEVLCYKEKVRQNYQELMEVLIEKEALEYERIDADLSRMQTDFFEYQGKIEQNILLLQETKSSIEKKLEDIKNGLPEDFKEESIIKKPEIHVRPSFKQHFFLLPISKETLSCFPFSIIPTDKSCIGSYTEEKRSLQNKEGQFYIHFDKNYIYAGSKDLREIFVYSLQTMELKKTLRCSSKIRTYIPFILSVEKRFYIIGSNQNENKILTFDERKVMMNEFTLRSNFLRFSNGEAGKVLITCVKHVILYDPLTKKEEFILIPANIKVFKSCSLGGDEFCMDVKINDKRQLVKVFNGKIIKVFNMENNLDVRIVGLASNRSGLVCIIDEDNMMYMMDRDLDVIFRAQINFSGDIDEVYIDDVCNIHLLSYTKNTNGTYKDYLMKYKMILKGLNQFVVKE